MKRLQKIKILCLDVDGILTDAKVFWVKGQGFTRFYSVYDGYGLQLLQEAGIEVAILSAGNSEDVRARMDHLKIRHVYLGSFDKKGSLEQVLQATGLKAGEAAFMGDELFDIPALEAVGLAATVSQARPEVFSKVHYICKAQGGAGAVRELADLILSAKKVTEPKRAKRR